MYRAALADVRLKVVRMIELAYWTRIFEKRFELTAAPFDAKRHRGCVSIRPAAQLRVIRTHGLGTSRSSLDGLSR